MFYLLTDTWLQSFHHWNMCHLQNLVCRLIFNTISLQESLNTNFLLDNLFPMPFHPSLKLLFTVETKHILFLICLVCSRKVLPHKFKVWELGWLSQYSVWLRTGPPGKPGSIPDREKEIFSSSLCVQTSSGAHPDSCRMGAVGPLPRCKARPRHDADHSPPSSAEVMNE
jgi:hypothetical protein